MKGSAKIAAVLLAALISGAASAQPPAQTPGQISRAIAELAGENGITVRVVPIAGSAPVIGTATGQDTLELGSASYVSIRHGAVSIGKHQSYFTMTTEFGLELLSATGDRTGAATLSAYLIDPGPYCQYYLDGVRLTRVAQPITLQLRYSTVSTHTLQIRVPTTAPAGPLQVSIGWIASSSEVPNGLS